MFVLDEADVMIDTQGHKDQTIRIHRTLSNEQCQFLFFSATYDDEVMKFAEKIVPNANIIKLKREEETLSNIKQYQVWVPALSMVRILRRCTAKTWTRSTTLWPIFTRLCLSARSVTLSVSFFERCFKCRR